MGNSTTTSKDLGLVKAIYDGTTPPANKLMIWADTSGEDTIHKSWSNTLEAWLPLGTESGSVTIDADVKLGRVIFVSTDGSDTTGEIGNLAKTFKTIPAAITKAITLSPTANNRVSILIYSGIYSEAVILNTDYIDLYSFDSKAALYNEKSFVSVVFEDRKRDVVIQNAITWNSRFNYISGIDVLNINLQLFSAMNSFRSIRNSVIDSLQTVNVTTTSTQNNIILNDCLVNRLFDCKINVLFIGIETNNCLINNAFDSGTVPASYPTNVRVQDSVFKNTIFSDVSFSFNNVGFQVTTSRFDNCVFRSDCISLLDQSTVFNCIFRDNAIKNASGSTIMMSTFGLDCIRDFSNTTLFKLTTLNTIGSGSVLDYLSGNVDDVSCNYDDGFANGRYFYGKMRHMVIRAINVDNPALKIKRPTSAIPANIESCTIIHCAEGGNTVVGDDMYLSYCKLNKINSNLNVFGGAASGFNIISDDLCNYIADVVCTPPSTFTLVSAETGVGGVTFTFNATLPTTRAGTQLRITKPDSSIVLATVEVGNSGGAAVITFTYVVSTPMEGIYNFAIRTICAINGSGDYTSVSSFSNNIGYFISPS